MTTSQINFDWYEFWMKQSKIFFETAQENLSELFKKNVPNPEQDFEKIQQWLSILKEHWHSLIDLSKEKRSSEYFQELQKMYQDGLETLHSQWLKRYKQNKPIKNITELYELWLATCKEIYLQADQQDYKKSYDSYSEAAKQFWKTFLPKI